MNTVAHRATRGHRTIRLPLTEADYERFLSESEWAREQLDRLYGQHPELFPEGWRQGYVFYGFTEPSRKQHLRCRRVRLRASTEVFSIAPAFVMPYMTAPDYVPETVNTDGWPATQGAWKALFPTITVILCFLHAFLKIRDRATKALAEYFEQVSQKVWRAYRAPNKAAFAQRLRRLREWAKAKLPDSPMKNHTLDLCDKRARFSRCYDHERAHRTSNLVDRLMKFLDRACFNAQYFHGTLASAERRVRALALLWNFCPSSPRTVRKHQGQRCPAERLNHKRYAENWLENLLVSGSMNGLRHHQQNPL